MTDLSLAEWDALHRLIARHELEESLGELTNTERIELLTARAVACDDEDELWALIAELRPLICVEQRQRIKARYQLTPHQRQQLERARTAAEFRQFQRQCERRATALADTGNFTLIRCARPRQPARRRRTAPARAGPTESADPDPDPPLFSDEVPHPADVLLVRQRLAGIWGRLPRRYRGRIIRIANSGLTSTSPALIADWIAIAFFGQPRWLEAGELWLGRELRPCELIYRGFHGLWYTAPVSAEFAADLPWDSRA